ncbi:alpha-glucosidase [Russula emetica]|nr:alpha-glucosidase [Russula emetica]
MLNVPRLWGIVTAFLSLLGTAADVTHAVDVDPALLDASNLVLAGKPCNVFGNDIKVLDLAVVYETDTRIHLKITDASSERYEVPKSVFPRPVADPNVHPDAARIKFTYTLAPFSFNISRASTGEVLFTIAHYPLIFEPQYLRLKTTLPPMANIYGLGEHSEPFRLDATNTTRTLWSRDAYGIPRGTNLYGNHLCTLSIVPYGGTHGVFLLSSSGMDVKVRGDGESATSLEYNVIGGVLDFYFLAGSETDPAEVARQYGYNDYIDVAGVISNYSAAGIPLETMWTDIGESFVTLWRLLSIYGRYSDYMFKRRIFTMDPEYFPPARMREMIDHLHKHGQRYGYETYDRGTELDVWVKTPNGSASLGVVWPGVTAFPDWFHPNISEYWTGEFQRFYNPETGFDIDGVWIDMNEPSSDVVRNPGSLSLFSYMGCFLGQFCVYPCDDPSTQAIENGFPPNRTSPAPNPNAIIFSNVNVKLAKRGAPSHAGDDLLNPPYAIDNAQGVLSNLTAFTNSVHANGLVEYDTHNLYGTMMSTATQEAMLTRRPGLRTLVITRSTFAGAGHKVGKWLGDNLSTWEHYRTSIAGMLGMATVFQVPMIGSDICGFGEHLNVRPGYRSNFERQGGNTTETLCARWAMLGAFYPFMRNHNSDTSISQEFYRWPLVTQAAKNALDIRYRLLDYFYTAFHKASVDGSPVVNPLWFKYPTDTATFGIDLQFLFGDSILVSPVTEENITTVTIYLPKDRFYDFATFAPVEGTGQNITLTDVNFTMIPLHIRGGAVLPLRTAGAMTTTELRTKDFEFVVAPDAKGTAAGSLYVDDGVSIVQEKSTSVEMEFGEGKLCVNGSFAYDVGVKVASVAFLGVENRPMAVAVYPGEDNMPFSYDGASKMLRVQIDMPLTDGFEVTFH